MSGSETAFFSLPPYTLQSYQKSGDSRKKIVASLLHKPQELLVTILILNIFCNILIQNTVSSLFGTMSGWLLKVGVPLAITLVIGEIIPKSLAISNNAFISQKVSVFLQFFYNLIAPIRIALTKITNFLSHYLFFFLKRSKPLTKDELQMIVTISEQEGILDPMEKRVIDGYLDLLHTFAKEKMRPRDEIVYYRIGEPIDQLIQCFTKRKAEKIPVCQDDLNNVLGMINFDMFFENIHVIKNSKEVRPYLSKPLYLPDTTLCWDALILMEQKKEFFALIVDEYGIICGEMSREDLFESIIGEVHGVREEKQNFRVVEENVIIASGKMEIEEFEKFFGVILYSKSHPATIAGFILDQLGDIPQSGTKFKTQDFLFYILGADEKKIDKIFIRRLKIL
ncbi:MAG: HlyC/CorC family transporter [Parachlamydiales bacterium]|nr:HlyC/CorC family transporter [Parachlamydiales bacterium]